MTAHPRRRSRGLVRRQTQTGYVFGVERRWFLDGQIRSGEAGEALELKGAAGPLHGEAATTSGDAENFFAPAVLQIPSVRLEKACRFFG